MKGRYKIESARLSCYFSAQCPSSGVSSRLATRDSASYRELDSWNAFPKTPAWEFARFLALAKSGRPFLGNMVIGQWSGNSPALEAALKEQQRVDLERSLEYAKKKLGVGVRWRA